MKLDCAGTVVDLGQPAVMGVLNLTPDSFSDGGRFQDREAAITQAHKLVAEGAALVDVGGESTRPGAEAVSASEECRRIIPVIGALAGEIPVPISVDTSKPEVMREAVAAGAGMINDVRALRQPGALEVATTLGVPVCLMHMRGEPRTMQDAPSYTDVVAEVCAFLSERLGACLRQGMDPAQLVVDPGFGFGKTLRHNYTMLHNLERFTELGAPLLVGISRKTMIGAVLGKPAGERLYGGLAAAVIAALKGASLIRTHDVGPTVEALKIVAALEQAMSEQEQ